MGWVSEEGTAEHEGHVVGLVEDDTVVGGYVRLRELVYPKDDYRLQQVRHFQAGCECGWRSRVFFAPSKAEWFPFILEPPRRRRRRRGPPTLAATLCGRAARLRPARALQGHGVGARRALGGELAPDSRARGPHMPVPGAGTPLVVSLQRRRAPGPVDHPGVAGLGPTASANKGRGIVGRRGNLSESRQMPVAPFAGRADDCAYPCGSARHWIERDRSLREADGFRSIASARSSRLSRPAWRPRRRCADGRPTTRT
jgi:hypothetical protein